MNQDLRPREYGSEGLRSDGIHRQHKCVPVSSERVAILVKAGLKHAALDLPLVTARAKAMLSTSTRTREPHVLRLLKRCL